MSRFSESSGGINWRGENRLNSRNFDTYLDNIVDEGASKNPANMVSTEEIEMQPTTETAEILSDVDPNQQLPQKMDVMILTNGWNDKNERIVISIGENAASYKWMHERSSSQYAIYHKIFGILLIVFSTGLTAESILPSDNNNIAIVIIRRVFTYIITILSVLGNFLKLANMSEQHMSSALAFGKLYHDIQQQMCMYRKDRIVATKYVADVLKQYDSLVMNGPLISSKVITQFKNTFKASDIALPDIADRIQKIELVTEATPPTTINNAASKGQHIDLQDVQGKRYGRYGHNNLEQIHNCFQISGDITDKDIQNATSSQLRDMKQKYLAGMSDFEYQRFKMHANEDD